MASCRQSPSYAQSITSPPERVITAASYAVYIAAKQWRRVAIAFQQPDDVLIVEGVPVYDAELGAMAVFASSVTTRNLQRAARQPKA